MKRLIDTTYNYDSRQEVPDTIMVRDRDKPYGTAVYVPYDEAAPDPHVAAIRTALSLDSFADIRMSGDYHYGGYTWYVTTDEEN